MSIGVLFLLFRLPSVLMLQVWASKETHLFQTWIAWTSVWNFQLTNSLHVPDMNLRRFSLGLKFTQGLEIDPAQHLFCPPSKMLMAFTKMLQTHLSEFEFEHISKLHVDVGWFSKVQF